MNKGIRNQTNVTSCKWCSFIQRYSCRYSCMSVCMYMYLFIFLWDVTLNHSRSSLLTRLLSRKSLPLGTKCLGWFYMLCMKECKDPDSLWQQSLPTAHEQYKLCPKSAGSLCIENRQWCTAGSGMSYKLGILSLETGKGLCPFICQYILLYARSQSHWWILCLF